MKKHIKHIKSQTGSITLYVLISMLFMTMLLATIYTLSSNNEIAARNATRKIREIYETGIDNMDEVYSKVKEAGKPKIDVESIAIEGESVVYTGKQIQLSIITSPTDATIGDVKWSSSNTGYATVDENGRVTGVAIGKITIIATVDGVAATHEVEVKSSEEIDVSRVVITGKNTVKVGQEIQLVAVVLPNNATNKNVTWVSSNESIATVDSTGKVIGKKEGSVTITAIADGKVDTHEVTVTLGVTGLTLAGKSSITVGELAQIQKHIEPSGATWYSEVWTSSDNSIATVDELGRVTGISAGDVTITAVVDGITATHEMTVKNEATISYKAGLKTIYTEDVSIGATGIKHNTTDSELNSLILDSMDNENVTSTTILGYYYDAECTDPVENTDTFTRSTDIYIDFSINMYSTAYSASQIVGIQKADTYETNLGLYVTTDISSTDVSGLGLYTNARFSSSTTSKGVGFSWTTTAGTYTMYVKYASSTTSDTYKIKYIINIIS